MIITWHNVIVLLIGYFFSLVVGYWIIDPIIEKLSVRYLPSPASDIVRAQGKLPALSGVLDRFLFTSSFLLGYPEFIAVWLVVKLAGEWSPSKDLSLYYIFQIGVGLSVVISVLAAIGMKYLLQM